MQNSVELKLRKALAKLADKNVEKISVSALCEKAGISRASFYIYYKDIEDLVKQTREYIINKLDEQFSILVEITDNDYSEEKCHIFDDVDIALLKGLTGKNVYWEFAVNANMIIGPRFEKKMIELHGEDFYSGNKETFEFILNGAVATFYFDLLNYDKATYFENIKRTYEIVRELLPK